MAGIAAIAPETYIGEILGERSAQIRAESASNAARFWFLIIDISTFD